MVKITVWTSLLMLLLTVMPWAKNELLDYWRLTRIRSDERTLLANPPPQGTRIYSSSNPQAPTMPPAMARLLHNLSLVPGYSANYWYPPQFVLYAGMRQAAGGSPRFVALVAHVTWVAHARGDVDIEAVVPGVTFHEPPQIHAVAGGGFGWGAGPNNLPKPPEVFINSPVEDPKDASHLSFSFDSFRFGKPYQVDCWLQPDGSMRWQQAGDNSTIAGSERN
jgi:hypothetical protein